MSKAKYKKVFKRAFRCVPIVRKNVPNKVRVLMYHRITENCEKEMALTPAVFRQQLKWLKQHTEVKQVSDIDFSQCDRVEAPTICLTFDDGYRDNLYAAADCLLAENLTASLFISPHYVKNQEHFPWDNGWKNNEVLTECEAKELISSGAFTLHNHTYTHPDLRRLTPDQISDEIAECRAWLASLAVSSDDYFAYPQGLYNKTVVETLRGEFKAAFTTIPGTAGAGHDQMLIRRTAVQQSDSFRTFEQKMFGMYDWSWAVRATQHAISRKKVARNK